MKFFKVKLALFIFLLSIASSFACSYELLIVQKTISLSSLGIISIFLVLNSITFNIFDYFYRQEKNLSKQA